MMPETAKRFEVTTLDLLKTAAVAMMIADHVGLYLYEDPWLRIVGRGAAIVFGFLIGISGSTRVPPSWVVLGIGLSMLQGRLYPDADSANALDILISLALTRILMPYFERLHADNPWMLIPAATLMALIAEPVNKYLEYGPEVVLLALLGLAIRLDGGQHGARSARDGVALVALVGMNVLALRHFGFQGLQIAGCVAVISATILVLAHYRRTPVAVPGVLAPIVRFTGRNTLWIYAGHLAVFMVLGAGTPTAEPAAEREDEE